MTGHYLDQANRTAGEAADRQARWNCPGNLWMYEKRNATAQCERVTVRLQDGDISRQAYGFRNFENYRQRVQVLCS